MTKRTAVLIPLFILALVAVGCAGDTGGAGKAKSSILVVNDYDPVATAQAQGYLSTLAADELSPLLPRPLTNAGMEPASRHLFSNTGPGGDALSGMVALSTLVAADPAQANADFVRPEFSAKAEADGLIVVRSGSETAMLRVVEVNGQNRTFSVGSQGVAALGNDSTFPRVVGDPQTAQGVVLASGELVPVE